MIQIIKNIVCNKAFLVWLLIFIALALMAITGCGESLSVLKTQAKQIEGECMECFYARYMAREGMKESSVIFAEKCIKVLREQGCIKAIKENPDIYKDFNDCWKTRE